MSSIQVLRKFKTSTFILFLLVMGVSCAGPDQIDEQVGGNEGLGVEMDDLQMSNGPLDEFTIKNSVNYKNLQLFMITGTSTAEDIEYVPLKLAMEKKWVEIKETSHVNELEISNLSDKVIFINAGDIVKGGKQDRTLTYDMIIGPNSKNEPLASFCVESDRWSKRGGESDHAFASNEKMLTSRKLKIASKKDKNQQKVWRSVSDQTKKLSDNVSKYANKEVDVKSKKSASSLELALDNKELNKMKKEYKKHFIQLVDENTLGFAYAINGELYTVDIYNNKELFGHLYEKLLDAAIVEAITELDSKQKENEYIGLEAINNIFEKKYESQENIKDLNSRTRWISKEEEDKMIFISQDRKNDLIWVHKNIIIKDPNDTSSDVEYNIQEMRNDNREINRVPQQRKN